MHLLPQVPCRRACEDSHRIRERVHEAGDAGRKHQLPHLHRQREQNDADQHSDDGGGAVEIIVAWAIAILARSEMALGLYAQARTRLEAAVAGAPEDLRLRHALCDLLTEVGDRAAQQPLLDLTYDDWSRGRVDRKNADDLVDVAAIVRLDDNWQDANDTLRTAVRAEPKNPRPNILWGRVFLEKHAIAEAETSVARMSMVQPCQDRAFSANSIDRL